VRRESCVLLELGCPVTVGDGQGCNRNHEGEINAGNANRRASGKRDTPAQLPTYAPYEQYCVETAEG